MTTPTQDDQVTAPRLITFGERLRAARLLAGLTQAECADQLGWQQSQWSTLEAGRQRPEVAYNNLLRRLTASRERIQRYASIVGIGVDELLGQPPWITPKPPHVHPKTRSDPTT